jgi:hypothetical protein
MKIFFKIIKKNLKFFLTVFFSLCFLTTNSNADMFNKFKKGFYFEKYKTADEMKETLLELHPIGSSIDGLIKTLEKAGGKCGIYETKIEDYTDVFEGKEFRGKHPVTRKKDKISDVNNDDYYSCFYKVNGLSTGFICAVDWTVQVKINPENSNNILSLEVLMDKYCL